MADVENGRAADDYAAAQEAAEVAVELTETEGPEDKKRIARALQAVASIGSEAVRRGGNAARSGGGFARRGADTASGTVVRGAGNARRGVGSAGRGVTSGLNWLTGQVVAMGPRLKIRDQATLRARFPGRSDDEIAGLLVERAARATAAVGGATGAWAALPALPGVPGRGRRGDAGGRGDRDQARRRTARDLRHARHRQPHRPGARLHRLVGQPPRRVPGGRRAAAHRGLPAGTAAHPPSGRARPPVRLLAEPAADRRGSRGTAQPAGDQEVRPPDPRRTAPAPEDRHRHRHRTGGARPRHSVIPLAAGCS